MIFNSIEFLFLFLPISYFGFRVLSRLMPQAVIGWLVCASLFFYGWWEPKYLILLLGSALTNYYLALLIASRGDQKDRFRLTALGVCVNLGLLAVFKYTNFVLENASAILPFETTTYSILLPLAISFFTFQQIAYLIDVSKFQQAEQSLPRYLLFVTFFPQLIAGPIVHHKTLLPQLPKLFGPYDNSVIAPAITLIILGLSKKVLLADTLAVLVNPGFAMAELGATMDASTAWISSIAYTLQLYFDFSGYCDIAIGCALLFGIRLPLNFESPLKATNIIDFWRRWHMTLSQFLRDYLYIPLGGNRNGETRRLINLTVTMLIGGLWHGAGWTFVFWGALHGLFLVVNHTWRKCSLSHTLKGRVWRALCFMLTFSCVMFAFIFFRATTFESALFIAGSMLSSLPTSIDSSYLQEIDLALKHDVIHLLTELVGTNAFAISFTLLAFVIATTLPNSLALLGRERWGFENIYPLTDSLQERLNWQNNSAWAILCGVLLFLVVMSLTAVSPFLYFQF
ncbi:MAG: MBOAT family protein [Pseudomonadota bacterium]